jgi:uncharacterized membrane protein YgcG
LEAARAIIVDLLTIRADRDRYYYGMDTLFERHPDIIKTLCDEARGLMPIMFDGLIWRSRVTENGLRRVNYYVKHLLVDANGDFNQATEWITGNRDPKIVCHPVIALVTDRLWANVAARTFIYGKLWFLLTLIVFCCSQSILNHLNSSAAVKEAAHANDTHADATHSDADAHTVDDHQTEHADGDVSSHDPLHRRLGGGGTADAGPKVVSFELRLAIFICRCFIYFLSLGQLILTHAKKAWHDIKAKDFIRVGPLKVPSYLASWQEMVGLALTVFLVAMLTLEPILHCINSGGEIFEEHCPEGDRVLFVYSVFSAMALLCYYLLLVDLAVFSTRVSAFVLVCGRLLSEVALFLFGLTFFIVAFASTTSTLEQHDPDFAGIPKSAVSLMKIALGMMGGKHFDVLHDYPALLVAVVVFIISTVIFLLNLLIAQLSCAYAAVYQDMLGYARLNRGKIVTDTMPAVNKRKWTRYVESLRLNERVEFGEGDLGITGGIQTFEPANANLTTVDMIRRFGGSTSVAAQWPEEENGGDNEEDRFDRMEKMIEKAMKRMSSKGGKKGGSQSGAGSSVEQQSASGGGGSVASGSE